uniref:Uncharacterized protein n=1 Tax=Triticum urartu TaxID=4572 RepID=A0A8R7QQN8_TRIUA
SSHYSSTILPVGWGEGGTKEVFDNKNGNVNGNVIKSQRFRSVSLSPTQDCRCCSPAILLCFSRLLLPCR